MAGERTRPRLAVIDVGGTMVSEQGLVREAIVAALAEVGLPTDPGLVRQLRGRNQRDTLATAVAAAGLQPYTVERAISAFAKHVVADLLAGKYRLLPGVGSGLARLRQSEVRVVATTNFAVSLREPLLAVTGLAAHVEDAVSLEEVDGDPQGFMTATAMRRVGITEGAQVANIGDTANDLASGRAARVAWNIAVQTGGNDVAALAPQQGDVVVADFGAAVDHLLHEGVSTA